MKYSVKLIKEEAFGVSTVVRRNPFWKCFMENYQCSSCKTIGAEHTNTDYLKFVSTLLFQASILYLMNYVQNSLSLCTTLQQI